MNKKILHTCICTAVLFSTFAFSACNNAAQNTENPSVPSTPTPPSTPDPKALIYGTYEGKFNGTSVALVLSATLADFQNQVMPKKYTNITFEKKADEKWLITCYKDGVTPAPGNADADVLIDTNEDPFTALITIHGMGGTQINCEKKGGDPGLKIKGSTLKGYKGAQPSGVLTVPEGITVIGPEAFSGCAGISEVRFSSTLERIDAEAFNACTGIRELHFPESLKRLEDGAFYGCTGLNTLDFSKSTKLDLIEDNAFRGCENIEGQLNLPASVTRIGDSAFDGCENITGKVSFPASLTKIGKSAFLKCKNITEIDFSSCTKLTKIDQKAFNQCTALTDAKLPASLTSVGNIFTGCTKLAHLSIDPANSALCAENDIVYNKEKTKLLFGAPAVTKAVAMPENLTHIETNAFINNQALTEVKFSKNLIEIGDSAFSTCKGLQTVDFSESIKLEKIVDYAFNHCENITGTLVFPASLTEIGTFAFDNCKSITEIDLRNCTSAKLSFIGTQAFQNCSARFKVKSGSGLKEKLKTSGVQEDKIDEE